MTLFMSVSMINSLIIKVSGSGAQTHTHTSSLLSLIAVSDIKYPYVDIFLGSDVNVCVVWK